MGLRVFFEFTLSATEELAQSFDDGRAMEDFSVVLHPFLIVEQVSKLQKVGCS